MFAFGTGTCRRQWWSNKMLGLGLDLRVHDVMQCNRIKNKIHRKSLHKHLFVGYWTGEIIIIFYSFEFFSRFIRHLVISWKCNFFEWNIDRLIGVIWRQKKVKKQKCSWLRWIVCCQVQVAESGESSSHSVMSLKAMSKSELNPLKGESKREKSLADRNWYYFSHFNSMNHLIFNGNCVIFLCF